MKCSCYVLVVLKWHRWLIHGKMQLVPAQQAFWGAWGQQCCDDALHCQAMSMSGMF